MKPEPAGVPPMLPPSVSVRPLSVSVLVAPTKLMEVPLLGASVVRSVLSSLTVPPDLLTTT